MWKEEEWEKQSWEGKKDGKRTSKRKTLSLLIAVSPSTTTQEAPLQSGQLPLLERGQGNASVCARDEAVGQQDLLLAGPEQHGRYNQGWPTLHQ